LRCLIQDCGTIGDPDIDARESRPAIVAQGNEA
jgi:hypothetical protein